MERIENMAKNSLEALAKNNLSKESKKALTADIVSCCIGLTLLFSGLAVTWLFPSNTVVPPLLYTVGFVIEVLPIYAEALKGLFTKQLTHSVEILVAIAITAAFFSGQLVLSLLIPIILNFTHILEERSIVGGREAIDNLRNMQKTQAVLVEDGGQRRVDSSLLEPGQTILVVPGALIPADGTVLSGSTTVDQKSLTGEPEPFEASAGGRVFAGTVNLSGSITVRVDRKPSDSSFSNVLRLLDEAESITIPESRVIDRFLRYYIPFVLAVAAAVALIRSDITPAIAVLVASCPCGQMLVSSAPMIAALSAATKRGILIKNSKFIEDMTDVDAVVFDKTGTLTAGEMSVTAAFPSEGVSESELFCCAASAAAGSAHPISRAVIAYAEEKGIAFEAAESITEESGKGLSAIRGDGSVIRFGRREWIESTCGECAPGSASGARGSLSLVTLGGTLLGAIEFNDTVRPDACECISQLKALNAGDTVMLTGDRTAAAERIREITGIDIAHAQLLPEDKLERLRELREGDRCVLAVGDGINDALALKEATVGIAMGAMGSDLAIQSADIALMNNNLRNIPFTIRLARKTKRIIYENLVITMTVSTVMMALSAFGVITAVAGAILHNIGAFTVLINSSRLLKIPEPAAGAKKTEGDTKKDAE